jgi:hypothetical protein
MATRTTVEAVAANPPAWLDRCVTISGVAWLTGLHSGVEGLYLIDRRDEARRLRGRRHRIGVYYSDEAHDRDEDGAFPPRAEGRTLTGVVDSCERRGEAARRRQDERNQQALAAGSDEFLIIMLGGYCHYHGGAVVVATSRRTEPPARLERLVGANARDQYGTLVAAPPNWPYLSRLQRRADALAETLSAGDRVRLSALFGRFGAGRDELNYVFSDPDSAFRALRGPGRLERAILVELYDYRGRRIDEPGRTQDAFICFCRGPDCARSWPIHAIDTWRAPDRPYGCFEVAQDGGNTIHLRIGMRPAPLSEPAASARLAD